METRQEFLMLCACAELQNERPLNLNFHLRHLVVLSSLYVKFFRGEESFSEKIWQMEINLQMKKLKMKA